MLNLHEIESTIQELKESGTSVSAAEKLALLYIARDYMMREEEEAQSRRSPAPQIVQQLDEPMSDFRAACAGVPVDVVLDALDMHMEAIKVIYPREYEAVIKKIRIGGN